MNVLIDMCVEACYRFKSDTELGVVNSIVSSELVLLAKQITLLPLLSE